MRRRIQPPEFTSSLTPPEYVLAIGYLAMHLVAVPTIVAWMVGRGYVPLESADLYCYGVGMAFMLMTLKDFLRREFDTLCDTLPWCIREILLSYVLMYACNLAVSTVISFSGNPNNSELVAATGTNYGYLAAMSVLMAPIVEEMIFRAGIFGLLRKRSRIAAYAVTTLLFSLFHVLAYAVMDPANWIYLLQYIPVSFLLCRCYERSNTIWAPVFFHMLVNGVSVYIMKTMGS